jgi:hypothetical protein
MSWASVFGESKTDKPTNAAFDEVLSPQMIAMCSPTCNVRPMAQLEHLNEIVLGANRISNYEHVFWFCRPKGEQVEHYDASTVLSASKPGAPPNRGVIIRFICS